MKRLILAPHMDDEAMGCGGLMAKHPDECVVVVMTDSGEVREVRGHPDALEQRRPVLLGELAPGDGAGRGALDVLPAVGGRGLVDR